MLTLPDLIKRNIAAILEQAGIISTDSLQVQELSEFPPLSSLGITETALLCLVTADDLEEMGGTESFLMRGEVARLLKELAFQCLDLLETEQPDTVKMLLGIVDSLCSKIAGITGLPKYMPPEELNLFPVDKAPSRNAASALMIAPAGADRAEQLRVEIQALRELLASLVLARDQLTSITLRDIEAAYMRELGSLEAEAYQAECQARLLKATLEMMQASLNREEPIQKEEIDNQIESQYKEFKKVYDDFVRRAAEAADYRQRREAQQSHKSNRTSSKTVEKDAPKQNSGDTEELSQIEQTSGDDLPEETEEQELRRLYRKIAKAMHPDLHPDQDEATKELFRKAITAYYDFDLKTLREIDAIISGDISEKSGNLLEELIKERDRLLGMIRTVRSEIRAIKGRYPYTLKAILDDPGILEAEKRKLRDRLENAKRAAEVYQERITEIEKKYG
jgi:hypothetical protein